MNYASTEEKAKGWLHQRLEKEADTVRHAVKAQVSTPRTMGGSHGCHRSQEDYQFT